MFWFFAIPLLIGGLCLTIYSLDTLSTYEMRRALIQEIIDKEIKRKFEMMIIAAKIKEKFRDGDYHIVKTGLLDSNYNEVDEIAFRAKKDANDYYVGQVIPLNV